MRTARRTSIAVQPHRPASRRTGFRRSAERTGSPTSASIGRPKPISIVPGRCRTSCKYRCVQRCQPFYAYVPFTLVHFPTLPNPKFAGATGYGDLPDCLAEMDAHVGEILDAIDALGVHDDTIVVFTSDNGPEATLPWQGSSGPWRGYYFTHMEGSLRVPFIIRWPGHIPAGRASNEIMHEVDTYTTFAKIAGASV